MERVLGERELVSLRDGEDEYLSFFVLFREFKC